MRLQFTEAPSSATRNSYAQYRPSPRDGSTWGRAPFRSVAHAATGKRCSARRPHQQTTPLPSREASSSRGIIRGVVPRGIPRGISQRNSGGDPMGVAGEARSARYPAGVSRCPPLPRYLERKMAAASGPFHQLSAEPERPPIFPRAPRDELFRARPFIADEPRDDFSSGTTRLAVANWSCHVAIAATRLFPPRGRRAATDSRPGVREIFHDRGDALAAESLSGVDDRRHSGRVSRNVLPAAPHAARFGKERCSSRQRA